VHTNDRDREGDTCRAVEEKRSKRYEDDLSLRNVTGLRK
jgi:hypothetical protein